MYDKYDNILLLLSSPPDMTTVIVLYVGLKDFYLQKLKFMEQFYECK